MIRRRARVLVGSVAIALVASVGVTVPASATNRTEQQGVTKDEIVVVAVVADLDSLRSKGLIQQPKLTVGNLVKNWQIYFDEVGPINGRKVRVEPVVWDPLDATTYDRACTQITQDIKPFVALNSAGYRQSSIPCISVDGETPFMVGDPVFTDLLKASGNKLFALPPPSDVAGTTTADVVQKAKLVPKSAKIGILSSNDIGVKAGGDALEAQLKKNGYDVASKVEVNALSADSALINRESAAAVETFKAAGVDTVFIGIQFTSSQGYFQEAARSQAGFKNFIVDDAASMCSIFAASRIPVEVAGTPCVTAFDTRALPTKDGVKEDSEFEAECRTVFDEGFGIKSQPGVPSGDVTANGVTYVEDMRPDYCTIMSVLIPAMKKAGKNLTWDKVAKNLEAIKSAPAAYLSDGEGGFSKSKHYFANKVHLVTLNGANAQTAVDAKGLFNGCPAPVNCWVPQEVDGEEWFPVSSK
ncbi:MAG: ABC transporter substrate-binding protein [Actinobacteria bacterium]|nr:ABC transporter substrate-binding protein [Actinomycetota bacterium]